MPCPCHAPTMPFCSRPQHSTAAERRPCCAVALRRTAWSGHGMASVNQTRPHCVNQMGKTHFKPLAARHGRGTAWTRRVNGMLCVNRPLLHILQTVCQTCVTSLCCFTKSHHFSAIHKTQWRPSISIRVTHCQPHHLLLPAPQPLTPPTSDKIGRAVYQLLYMFHIIPRYRQRKWDRLNMTSFCIASSSQHWSFPPKHL